MAGEYDRLICDSIGKRQSSHWYMERLGLPLRDEYKGVARIPKFIDGCEEIEKLYLTTAEEVQKMVRCYSTIDELREAVTPPTFAMVKTHVETMYRRHASIIWSAEPNPMTQPSVSEDTCYDRPLVFNNPEDRLRIQYLLLGWIVHRAYRKLQKKANTGVSRKSNKMPVEFQATISRGRTRDVPNYRISPGSDSCVERWSISSASPFVPTEYSAEDNTSVIEVRPRRECRIVEQENAFESRLTADDYVPEDALRTSSSNKHGDSNTRPIEEKRAIRRRDISMPDGEPMRKRTFGRIREDSTEDAECNALLQEFKARKQTAFGSYNQDHPHEASNSGFYGIRQAETVDIIRPGQIQGTRVTQGSPFELHATPPSPMELADERVADLVASHEGFERYADVGGFGDAGDCHRDCKHCEGARISSTDKGKSIASHSPAQMEVDRRLLAIKLNDMLQEGYQQLTSDTFNDIEILIRKRWEADANILREIFGDAFIAYYKILDNWLKCVDGFVTYNQMTGFFGEKGSCAEHLANLSNEIKLPARRLLLNTGLMTATWRCDPDFTIDVFSRDLARVILNISHWSNSMAPGELEGILSGFNTGLFNWFD